MTQSMQAGPVASKHGNLKSILNAGSMALGSTTGRTRHGVGKGGGGGNREGNGHGGQGRQGTETERRRASWASWAEERGPREGERKKETVGGERIRALEVLRRRKCRLNLALTISGTGGTGGWNQRSGEWPRPKLTWAFSRRKSVLTESTPASHPDTAS